MKVLGRDAKREFTEPLTVTCQHPTEVTDEGVTLCGRTAKTSRLTPLSCDEDRRQAGTHRVALGHPR